MKNIHLLTLLLLIAISTVTVAQISKHGSHTDARSLEERLLAEAAYVSNGSTFIPKDSILFSYTGARNFDSLLHMSAFDQAVSLLYNVVSGDTFVKNQITLQTFDANNNMLTSTLQFWSTDSNAYINNTESIYTYDANNNLLTNTARYWGAAHTWVNQTMKIYTYDANNNQLSYAEQLWNTGTNQWTNNSNYLYSYNASNQLTQSVFQWWDGIWLDSTRNSYTYTAANQLQQNTLENWSQSGSYWYNVSQYQYGYNSGGKELISLSFSWSFVTASWQNDDETIYSLDVNNNDSARTTRTWNGSAWTNISQYLYTYDANGNQLSQAYQLWNTSTAAWKNTTRLRTTYDADNNPTYKVGDAWNAGGFWEYQSGDVGTYYYYQPFNTDGIATISDAAGSMKLYPVPASTTVNVDIQWQEMQASTISIYDASGRMYKQWQAPAGMSYGGSMPVADLPDGIYYMTAKTPNGQISKNFTIAR